MRKIILLSLLEILSVNVFAQAINVAWAKSVSGLNSESTKSVVCDSDGNVFSVGYFQGMVDVDPDAGFFNLTSAGQQDIFITKLNEDGMLIWAKRIGGVGNESGNSVCSDAAGNIYVTGYYHGMVDFDPGPNISNLIAATSFSQDVFLMKMDTAGNFLWAKSFSGTGYFDSLGNQYDAVSTCFAIQTTPNGDIVGTGSFLGNIDFDPGSLVYNLTSLSVQNVFIFKLSSSGHFIWAKQVGENKLGDEAYGIDVDSSGNIYTVGVFSDTVDFDPGPSTFHLSTDSSIAAFVLKLNAIGQFVWVRSVHGMGLNAVSIASCLAIDPIQQITIGGYFKGSMDVDPGMGISILNAAGSNDIFVLKLSINGDYLWAKKLGGVSSDYCYGMDIDQQSNIYINGSFRGNVDFDPGPDTLVLNSFTPNNADAYLLKLSASGNFCWAYRLGGTGMDVSNDINISAAGEIILVGSYANLMSLQAGANAVDLLATGGQDAFTIKLNQSQISLPLEIIYFYGKHLGTDNLLQWRIVSFKSSQLVELQHANEELDFKKLKQFAHSGETINEYSFDYLHKYPNEGENYYRLKLIDEDGGISFSKLVALHADKPSDKIQVSPNPVKNEIQIALAKAVNNLMVKLYDLKGNIVYKKEVQNAFNFSLDFSALLNGEYMICFESKQFHECQKVLIAH